jgi:hypothetical protein
MSIRDEEELDGCGCVYVWACVCEREGERGRASGTEKESERERERVWTWMGVQGACLRETCMYVGQSSFRVLRFHVTSTPLSPLQRQPLPGLHGLQM